MPLFGETIGLGELRDRVANKLSCDPFAAEAILSRKLRRAEIVAYCEWAYAVGGKGEVLTSYKLSPEPWILTRDIDWQAGMIRVDSPAAREITHAVDVYFRIAELDFLDEEHTPEDVARETPKRGRRPGTGFERADAPHVEQIVAMIRRGDASSASSAAQMIVGDGSGAAGAGTPESKVDRLTRRANAILDGGNNGDPVILD